MPAPPLVQPSRSRSPQSGSALGPLRIVDIAAFATAIEAFGIGHVQWSAATQARREIGVREELSAIGHGIGSSVRDGALAPLSVVSAVGDVDPLPCRA